MSGAAVFTSYVEKLKEKKVEINGEKKDILRINPLAFDLSSESLLDEQPWQKTEEFVPLMFDLWNELKDNMLPRFQTRKSRCEEDDMLQGIVSMMAMFYWIKGEKLQTVDWEEIKQQTFPVAPINWTERLEFILLKPTQYHCFIQLDELYTELKKQYGKYEALRKLKQNR
ncbi:YpoC family protein [Bacillus sp. FSL M8-0077]|uniref:YpoC family protein n=1 Tax=Bacillus sp. FSL M8-0077 TaxID=2954556 RepID=UPI0030FD6D92